MITLAILNFMQFPEHLFLVPSTLLLSQTSFYSLLKPPILSQCFCLFTEKTEAVKKNFYILPLSPATICIHIICFDASFHNLPSCYLKSFSTLVYLIPSLLVYTRTLLQQFFSFLPKLAIFHSLLNQTCFYFSHLI